MNKKENFLFLMWKKPEQTVCQLNYEIDQQAWLVLLLLGISITITTFVGLGYFKWIDRYSWQTVLLAVSSGFFGSASYFYLGGYIFSFVGRWFYGVAKPNEVRTAIIFSAIPLAITIPFWLPSSLLLWSRYNNVHLNGLLTLFLLLIAIPSKYIANFLYLFSFALLVRTLAAVHLFSKWYAFFTIFIGSILTIIPIIIYSLIKVMK